MQRCARTDRVAPADWRVVEELRIGAVDSGGAAGFAEVGALVVDALDRIWVLGRQAREVRVLDAADVHARTVARDGAGPPRVPVAHGDCLGVSRTALGGGPRQRPLRRVG